MPTVAVKKIPEAFDPSEGATDSIKIVTSYGLAQQILGGVLQSIGLSSFIFRRSKVISFSPSDVIVVK